MAQAALYPFKVDKEAKLDEEEIMTLMDFDGL